MSSKNINIILWIALGMMWVVTILLAINYIRLKAEFSDQQSKFDTSIKSQDANADMIHRYSRMSEKLCDIYGESFCAVMIQAYNEE